MSFLHWFSAKKALQTRSAASPEAAQADQGGNKSAMMLPGRLEAERGAPEDGRKVKRHARREQMYVAIREAMTRAGVLSASYKFKVLSLDQGGDEFLVMMDLERVAGDPSPQLGAIESLIVQSARLRFEISVPAVYWRVHEVATIGKPVPHTAENPASGPQARPVPPRYEPIQADEVAAFQQALLAASARRPGAVAEKGVMMRSGMRLPALRFDDFEDTEVTVSTSSPVLSNTQYGELN